METTPPTTTTTTPATDSPAERQAQIFALRMLLHRTPLPAWLNDAEYDRRWRTRMRATIRIVRLLRGKDGDE